LSAISTKILTKELGYFCKKKFAENSLTFFDQTTAGFCKNLIATLAFGKEALFC
jgi:hypothetical protein